MRDSSQTLLWCRAEGQEQAQAPGPRLPSGALYRLGSRRQRTTDGAAESGADSDKLMRTQVPCPARTPVQLCSGGQAHPAVLVHAIGCSSE